MKSWLVQSGLGSERAWRLRALRGARRTRRSELLLCAFAKIEEQHGDHDSRRQSDGHRGLVFNESKRHHETKQRRKDQPNAHRDHQSLEKISRVIAHTPGKVLVDMNGRESLNPGFAETEALVAIDGYCLPQAGGDIEQQQRRKENSEETV